jgi:hypothetical protein
VEPYDGRAIVANLDAKKTWKLVDLAGGEQTPGELPEESPEPSGALSKEKNGCL